MNFAKCIFYEKKEDILANADKYDAEKLAFELGVLDGVACVLGSSYWSD